MRTGKRLLIKGELNQIWKSQRHTYTIKRSLTATLTCLIELGRRAEEQGELWRDFDGGGGGGEKVEEKEEDDDDDVDDDAPLEHASSAPCFTLTADANILLSSFFHYLRFLSLSLSFSLSTHTHTQ